MATATEESFQEIYVGCVATVVNLLVGPGDLIQVGSWSASFPPSFHAGYAAPLGSLLSWTVSPFGLYQKQGPLNTDWVLIGGGAPPITPTTVLLTNNSGFSMPPGTPVYSSGFGTCGFLDCTDITKSVCVGLTTATIANGAMGSVQFAGVLTLTTAQWDNVTGLVGGLTVAPPTFYGDPAAAGTITNNPGAIVHPNIVEQLFNALSTTEAQLQLQPPIPL